MQLFMKEGNNTHFVDCHKKKLQKLSDFHFYKSKVLMWQFPLLCKKNALKNRGKEIKNQVRSLASDQLWSFLLWCAMHEIIFLCIYKDLTWLFISIHLLF